MKSAAEAAAHMDEQLRKKWLARGMKLSEKAAIDAGRGHLFHAYHPTDKLQHSLAKLVDSNHVSFFAINMTEYSTKQCLINYKMILYFSGVGRSS